MNPVLEVLIWATCIIIVGPVALVLLFYTLGIAVGLILKIFD